MSEYALGDLHIDQHLSQVGIARRPEGLIADILAPVVPVDFQRDSYIIWGQDNFRAPETLRSKGGKSNTVQFSVTSSAYFAANHGLQHVIPLEDLANADKALRLRERKTEFLKDNMSIAWENRVASTVTSTSNVGSSVTLSSSTEGQFNDYANSEPEQAIRNGMRSVRAGAKRRANTIAFGYDVWDTFIQHPGIRAAIFPHGGGVPTEEDVAKFFFGSAQRGRVLIGEGIKNTGSENLTDAFSDIWSGDVFIGYLALRPDMEAPSYMYTFQWTPDNFPGPYAVATSVEGEAGSRHVEIIESLAFQDEKVTLADAGYLIKAAIA